MSISKKLMTAGGGPKSVYVDDVFSTYLYTGSGSGRNILNGIDLEGEGGMVWIKNRSSATNNQIADSENNMGTGNYTFLSSNTSDPVQYTPGSGVQQFLSNGFGVYGGATTVNASGQDYVSWTFRKQPGFFDVVKYSGTATSPTDTSQFQDVPHNLGTTPGMIIVKKLNNDGSLQSWVVNHRAFDGSTRHIKLNSSSQTSFSNNYFGNNLGSGDHSSTFRVVCDEAVNAAGDEYIAYLFAHDESDESMIKCGSYTGNENPNGPEIDLGFEPQWLLQKQVTGAGDDWHIFDNMRGVVTNHYDQYLRPNGADDENQAKWLNFTASGFKIASSQGNVNKGGEEYIYMAIRRPNKPAEELEPEELFNTDSGITDSDPSFRSNFVPDMGIYKFISQTSGNYIQSRLTGNKYLQTNDTMVEDSTAPLTWDWMDGFGEWRTNVAGANHWSWRRAPGFFDVVTYSGNNTTGSYNSLTIPHNLGAVPQMIWVKARSASADWVVWAEGFQADTTSEYLFLNANSAKASGTGNSRAFTADPTEDNFTVGPWGKVNGEWDYIAYLFASVPGISKVGSYTGDGASSQDIDCGFTNGARFVLIKRTEAAGGWYVFDAERGIYGLDAPALRLNENYPQETGQNNLDPLGAGFTVRLAAANLNTSGGNYIFYAIA